MTLGGACEQEALLQGGVETGENSQLPNLTGKSLESSLMPPFSAQTPIQWESGGTVSTGELHATLAP